ncbi:hypothetical protein CBR_g31239 [Chara braunii]|uniref:Methyltransferase n=1 Tax=Chara braunii TaxID=69332 RepID=A0A388JY16_CHABU|nr:hypothetical protein CBR_g31239 [Chara braunii]|eukprot:GBG62603.1 hypothetical protein CBR_g31239 [Chara braunii]
MGSSGFRSAKRERDRSKFLPAVIVVVVLCGLFFYLGRMGVMPPAPTTNTGVVNQFSELVRPDANEEVKLERSFEPCANEFVDYTPCEDTKRSLGFPREHYEYRERHCPRQDELLRCLIPPPKGYRKSVPWPESRRSVWYNNVPFLHLTREKANQNWVKHDPESGRLIFPGGGTMFPNGATAYINDMDTYLHFGERKIRTALDAGCGVASWGAYLLDRDILTVSFAPRDTHVAQVQFALERGVPAIIGILATKRLPYPSNSFDLAHCSRCLIPWYDRDGLFLIEINRLLRPGGYWVLSGPPVNWQQHEKEWHNVEDDQRKVMSDIETIAERLCWEYVAKGGEAGDFAIWRKPRDGKCYSERQAGATPPVCGDGDNPDAAWYTPMTSCLAPLPNEEDPASIDLIPRWPDRLNTPSPRLANIVDSEGRPMFSNVDFNQDSAKWKKAVDFYAGSVLPDIAKKSFRNVLDMNAGLGSFAAALHDLVGSLAWVMNAVMSSGPNTLPVIFDRGLIGTYQDWCEAFSSYPRTYDLIHAASIFGHYGSNCDPVDILLEMDRLLRPEGSVIIRDNKSHVKKVARIVKGMRWDCKGWKSEDAAGADRLLVCKKQNWADPEAGPAKDVTTAE